MCSAERSEAKTPRPKTEYCRKQDHLPPAFFMSLLLALLLLAAIKRIVTALTVSEIEFLTEIGGVANEVIPRLSYITLIIAVMHLLSKESRVRFANIIAVFIMVYQIGDHAAI